MNALAYNGPEKGALKAIIDTVRAFEGGEP